MHAPQPQLLVVDDDRAILMLVGSIAHAAGFDVATTTDGREAMQLLERRPADLVLLDLRMPGTTGLETLRAIPWQFAWTQTRLLLASWLGIEDALDADDDMLRDMYTRWKSLRRRSIW